MSIVETMAKAYAKATTNKRCADLPDCKGCTVRFCDYKSRYEAYIQGYKAATRQVMPCGLRTPLTTNIQP